MVIKCEIFTLSLFKLMYNMHMINYMARRGDNQLIPYSGYNLRGAISANHQISHLEVIFAIIEFANHSMVLRGHINLRA